MAFKVDVIEHQDGFWLRITRDKQQLASLLLRSVGELDAVGMACFSFIAKREEDD